MNFSTPIPDPICWHEGDLLTPQHFQQDQRYWHERMLRMQQQLNPMAWGISKLKIDAARLVDGVIAIQQLSATLPDGLIVDYDERSGEPLILDINELELPDDKPVKVHLAVPVFVPGGASDNATIQRFDAIESRPVVDDNTGENPHVITRLQSRITLVYGDKPGSKYTTLPLLEVHKPEGANYELTAFVPPLIQVEADDFRLASEQGHLTLAQSCQQLAIALRQKARLFSELALGDESRLGTRVSELHKTWIRAMVSELPAFELLADDPCAHPVLLYRNLAKLVGAIHAISPLTLPPKLSAYRHADCYSGFDDALRYISGMLEKVNVEYSTLEFEQTQSGIFSILFDKAWHDREILIELIASSDKTRDSNQTWMNSSRIASASVLKKLATQRLLGASSEFLEVDDTTGLKSTNTSSLFRIKADPRYIKTGQQLVIMCTNSELHELRPATIRLHLSHD